MYICFKGVYTLRYIMLNLPEPETIGDMVMNAYARMRKKQSTERNGGRWETRYGNRR